MRGDHLPEHLTDRSAGGVTHVQHAPHAVRGLATQRRLALLVLVEGRAPLDQLAHVARALANEHVNGLGETEAVAGRERIARVQIRRVVIAHRRGDAALRVAGVALARIGLGQQDDAADIGQRDRRAQTGDPAADHEEVGDDAHVAILSMRNAQCSMPNAQRTETLKRHWAMGIEH